MYASGSSIDCFTYASTGWPAFAAASFRWSRSGPTLPLVPAGVNVWQAPHVPVVLKSVAAAADEPPPPPPAAGGGGAAEPVLLYHLPNSAVDITTAWLRISEWPSPQSSVQMTG